MTKHKFITAVFILTAGILSSDPAWALYSPEPQSGGRFFPGKGTRAATAYEEYQQDPNDASYGRTEAGSFDRHHYAKGLNYKGLRLRPSLGYTGEYDSNIYLSEDNREGDYISKLLGGVDAEAVMDGGKYAVTGGVQTKSEWFAKNSGENHTDWTYQLGGEVHLSAIDLIIHDEFRDTSERTDGELTQRLERFENRLSGLATIPFGEFFSETEVSDFIVDFRDNDTVEVFNRHEFSVYPRLGMNIGPRTQALAEYGYTDINYENQSDRDGRAHQGQLGLRGYIGEADLIAYQIWGGWQFRNYESSNFENFSGFIGHAQVSYKLRPATRLTLQAVRRPEESRDTGQTFFTRNEVNFQARQQIAEQWFVTGRAGTGFNHYNNDRLDFLWEPGAGVEYVLPGKMVALFTEYKFSGRVSDAENRDYSRHIVSFGIKAQI